MLVLDPYSGWTTSEQAGHSAHRSVPSAVSYSISTYPSEIDALQSGHVPSADCRVCIVLKGGGPIHGADSEPRGRPSPQPGIEQRDIKRSVKQSESETGNTLRRVSRPFHGELFDYLVRTRVLCRLGGPTVFDYPSPNRFVRAVVPSLTLAPVIVLRAASPRNVLRLGRQSLFRADRSAGVRTHPDRSHRGRTAGGAH